MPNLDAALHNADWLRARRWDLPETVEGLLSVLTRRGESDEEALARFLQLPAAQAMPEPLRSELEERGLVGRFDVSQAGTSDAYQADQGQDSGVLTDDHDD